MEIENQEYDQERALYDSHNVIARNCRFDGPADGESAFKESSDIVAEHCYFNLINLIFSFSFGSLFLFLLLKLNPSITLILCNKNKKVSAIISSK